MCAVDVDDGEACGPLRVAADLAVRLGRQLVVAHVAPPGPFPTGGPAVTSADRAIVAPAPAMPNEYPVMPEAAEVDEARAEARQRIERLLRGCGIEDAQVVVALDDSVADGLRRIAADHDTELLVVGSRGHGTVRAALLGSTSHALVADAPCPVVVAAASD
ncbi:MAG: universal stress protein [Chloroflexota bacterium]|nr:universal stress protein [Chloroflexota bacterium]